MVHCSPSGHPSSMFQLSSELLISGQSLNTNIKCDKHDNESITIFLLLWGLKYFCCKMVLNALKGMLVCMIVDLYLALKLFLKRMGNVQ